MDVLRAVFLGVVLFAACVYDVRLRRIPNGLTLAALLVALALAGAQAGLPGLGRAAAGVAVASVALLGYAARALGAGDVKLLWTVGAVLGPRSAGVALLCTILAAGALGLAWIAGRFGPRLPCAPAIAAGAVAALWLAHGEGLP